MIPYPVSHNVTTSAFSPTDIASLVLWFDPDEITDTGSNNTADVLLNQATAPAAPTDGVSSGAAVPIWIPTGYTASQAAIEFDGSNNYYSNATYGELQFATSDPWSVSFWIRPTAGDYYIFDSTSTGRGAAPGMGVYFAGTRMFVELLDGVGGEYSRRTGVVQDPGVWHQYTITYDGSENGGGFAMYEDGVLLASVGLNTIFFTDTTHNTGAFEFGRSTQTSSDYANGRLGHLMVFDSVLTSQNITDLATYY